MKKLVLILITFFLIKIVLSQNYSFPIYFEDASGNKDTLHFGFDESASFEIDENIGEVNLIGQPYDSSFFIFFTDAVTIENKNCDLVGKKSPSYISKEQIVNVHNTFFIELGLIIQNWPLTVSWDQNEISSFDIGEYSGYPNHQIIMTGFHPPSGWFDGVCCGSGWPDMYMVLSDTSGYSIDQDRFCKYNADFSNEEISLLYLGFIDKTTSAEALETSILNCWYNEESESISIQNTGTGKDLKFEVFNIYGSKIIDGQIFASSMSQTNISISHLNNGIYIIRLYENKINLFSTYKIIKR